MLCERSQGTQLKTSMQQNNTDAARDTHLAKSLICHVDNLLTMCVYIYI